jgi:altronate hydrolase
LGDVAVQLHVEDNVAIAKTHLQLGTILLYDTADSNRGDKIPVRQLIPSGHKIALAGIPRGGPVRRYGQVIGFATQAIQPGEHVHKHNLGMGDLALDYAFGVDAKPLQPLPNREQRDFLGYERPDGRVGTRNYIAVLSTVTCSASVCRAIARHFTPERLAAYPNVAGVMAVTHPSGCSILPDGPTYTCLQRTLAGYARHPNVAASIFVGLGCEVNQVEALFENYGLPGSDDDATLRRMVIQDMGGSRSTITAAVEAIEAMLPQVNELERTPQPVSELTLALQCGGSDGWSGVTANPLVGLVSDRVVRHGGSVVLAETTEVYGVEHLLTRRAVSAEVGQKLVEKVHWWEEHTRRNGTKIDNNPTPGNIAGGLTTIYEKSMGAIAKGGHTNLVAVLDYAEPVSARGFNFMDSPGNDPVAVTGQIATGANLVLFTTGRGSVVGSKPAPTIKIASNSPMYRRMEDDMDFNAGRVLEGEELERLAEELFDLVVAVASGQLSKSEALGFGDDEFAVWQFGDLV